MDFNSFHRDMLLKIFGFIPDCYHEYILPIRVEIPTDKSYFNFPINHPVIDMHDVFLVDRMYMVMPPKSDFPDQDFFNGGHLRISVNNVILSYLNLAHLINLPKGDFFPILPNMIFAGSRNNVIECNLPTWIYGADKAVFLSLYLRGWYFPGVVELK